MGDKAIGIVKATVGTVLGLAGLVLVARYQSQLGSFLNTSASALVTLGNGVSNFGGGTSSISTSLPSLN